MDTAAPLTRIARLRAEILRDPSAVHRAPSGLLPHALHGADVTLAHRPDLLVTELIRAGLRAEALRLTTEGLHTCALTPSSARSLLLKLAENPADDGTTEEALRQLAQPWASLTPLPHPFPLRTDASLTLAARHGHLDPLRDAVTDRALPPALRRRALELLGGLAERGQVGALIETASRDPLLYGAALLTCLRGMHQRGHFATDADVPALVTLALADHSIRPRDLATTLFTCRHALLHTLLDAPPGDPTWPRRLDLLVALAAQGTGDLPVGAEITRALAAAPHSPEPFLAALRELRHESAEEAVLALLPSAPRVVLHTLEAIGGDRTVRVLRAAFGLDGEDAITAAHLLPVRRQALGLLWQLTRDPAHRAGLLARLDPTDLPPAVAADLGAPDEHELDVLRSHLDPGRPKEALLRLAAHGSSGTLPVLADLLLRLAGELAAAAEPGASPHPLADERPEWQDWPAGEPEIPQDVVEALRDLGARLHLRQHIRPHWHLDAADPAAAGHALVTDLALGLLERPGLHEGEQAVLLRLLLAGAPSPRTRPRVHRLLRHPDRHVRKHVIALLARDTDGEDARALSATLINLTRAQDVQTVRQALLALGHARAHWASAEVAARLDHPNMNVRKTAADVLSRIGTPDAVPDLLRHLGRQRNPGLRSALVRALRAILGPAYAATVLEAAQQTAERAAEQATEPAARDLLLAGLDGALPVRSFLALHAQAHPVAPALFALLPDHRVCPSDGSLADLAVPLGREPQQPSPAALLARRWDPEAALHLASAPIDEDQLPQLRPHLDDWLRLTATAPHVLAFALRLCPAPWAAAEIRILARHLPLLLSALEPGAEILDALLPVLEAVAPTLLADEALTVVDAVRALPAVPGRPALALLRACGAALVRADLERALEAAGRGRDPWQAEVALLREAFGLTGESRRKDLAALIESYPSTDPADRPALLDRIEDLQPLGVPPLPEAPEPTRPRVVQDGDLDQPRSAAQYARLLALLDAPEQARRKTAADVLLSWPEPEAQLAALKAYLQGRLGAGRASHRMTCALHLAGPEVLHADGVLPERALDLACELDPWDPVPHLPRVLDWWEHGPEGVREQARRVLRQAPADLVAELVADRLAVGAWGVLDLLALSELQRSPLLDRVVERLRAEGRTESLTLTDGPLRAPGAAARDAEALAGLRERAPAAAAARPPSRAELLALARSGDREQIRRALTRLTEEGTAPDAELRDLLAELMSHDRPAVRLHAHRTSRALLAPEDHLRLTETLLADPQTDVRCMAVRVLCGAGWEPAVPAVVALLDDAHPVVRRTAAQGVRRLGTRAVPALQRSAAHARPDRRALFTNVLKEVLTDALTEPEAPAP
ncbi:hypothetical protein GCM10010329_24190 [Streptomyces spiroverticillatus]|uniref:HEAT repeat domain-containing protein n=1 Tax=Streptomyces finlayi TaxID=67296 RepID=A0A918WV16_9ACTN|nr:HEAT repeat domain-containing protein [Streptomyces finlayi]GHA01636.1 hypothetical protein GCM10010329_24190 [Streptomyces spiroverticillatus]GHC85998.1 hypothetical protein GCM10010334_16610 [Streptomyces finlayi]